MRVGRVGVVLFVAATALGPRGAGADAPRASDPVEGLLAVSSDVRAAAAARIGSGDLVAAAPAIPVLVETLDDEVPAVAAAAERAIEALAQRALPVVEAELKVEPFDERAGSLTGVLLGLGDALSVTDLVTALAAGSAAERETLWLAFAVAPLGAGSPPGATDSAIRHAVWTTALEATSAREAERPLAAAASAFLARRLLQDRSVRGRGAPPSPLAFEPDTRFLRDVRDASSPVRALFSTWFLARVGASSASVVEVLVERLDRRRALVQSAGETLPRALADALARASTTSERAGAALLALDDASFVWLAPTIAAAGRADLVAGRAIAASHPGLARIAALHGAREPALEPLVRAELERQVTATWTDWARLTELGRALASFDALDDATVTLLGKVMRFEVPAPHRVPVLVAAAVALLHAIPAHAPATTALVELVREPAPADGGDRLARRDALLALGRSNQGRLVLDALVGALDPVRGTVVVEAAAEAIASLRVGPGPSTAAALARLLGASLEGDGPAGPRRASVVDAPYRIRAAALRTLGRLDCASAEEIPRIRPLRASPDPRLRCLAARALRRIPE